MKILFITERGDPDVIGKITSSLRERCTLVTVNSLHELKELGGRIYTFDAVLVEEIRDDVVRSGMLQYLTLHGYGDSKSLVANSADRSYNSYLLKNGCNKVVVNQDDVHFLSGSRHRRW